jgi:hypothetical protein
MIYLMPIDECFRCGARTPRICPHSCPEQLTNGHIGPAFDAELQSWIGSLVAASSARSTSPTPRRPDLLGAIRAEPHLTASAKRHLIGLVKELRRRADQLEAVWESVDAC